jgi:amino acid adenylation domain-containing protein
MPDLNDLNDLDFLRTLRERGIEVRAGEGRLRINAPAGAVTKALQEELLRRKSQLLILLDPAASPQLVHHAGATTVPLTHAQESIWLVERFYPGTPAYSIPEAFLLDMPVDREILREAMRQLLGRHEILRSYIREINGQAVQQIMPETDEMALPLGYTDLSPLDEAAREAALHTQIRQMARIPFDLMQSQLQSLLIRCHLFRLTPSRHVAFVNVHHIISDRQSMEILQREIGILYLALASKRPHGLPPLPIQFADYAIWERERAPALHTNQFAYWKTKLANTPGHLELPFSKPRPSMQTFAGDIEPFAIPEPLAASLRQLAQSHNASLYMLLLAAFATLLHRYTGKDDFCIGSPISGRNRAETEPLIGLFVNALVLRCQPQPTQTFRQLLHQVRDTALEAYAHSDVSLQRLVAELHPERDPGSSPFFQIMFALDSFPKDAPKGPAQIDTEPGVAKFDLTLQLSESGAAVSGHFEYRIDLFDKGDIRRFDDNFLALLEEIAHKPDEPIAGLNLLSTSERQKILVDWNKTALDFPKTALIHQLFEQQVEKSPQAIAAIHGTQSISYGDLNKRANQLAHLLIARGVKPGICVGICLNRSLSMLVAMLATLKAGAAYVPLDPAYPGQRLQFMVEDSRLAILIAETNTLSFESFASFDKAKVVSIDAEAQAIASQADHNPAVPMRSSDLAYVIYTSGSTGKPKGVAIEHHSTVSFLHWGHATFPDETLRYVLASTSICFDLSIFEIFLPLSTGHTVVIAENALEISRLPAAQQITLVNTVPSTMAALLKADAVPQSVACINLAGEALSVALVNQIHQQLPGAQIFDLYGPTETTTYSTFTRRYADAPASIGRPLANTRIYLLDGNLQLVPIGVPGQIFIAGEGVARGYLHRPDLTAERFIRLDHLQEPSRAYQTGDLGRYLPGGNIEYLGRMDQQVKIRGFRIELGEIESALRSHPQVEDAAVLVQADALLGSSLTACILAKDKQPIDTAELIVLQRRTLPAYMVVTQIHLLDSFPYTPNGKVDRKTMGASLERPVAGEAQQTAPRNPLERELVEIWEACFERTPIGIDEDFFALGGHSLLALRLFSEIEKRLGKTLMLSLLLHAPTIRQLAILIRSEA